MKILAIETSCDETSIAFLEATGGLKAPKFRIIANVVSSQIELHRPFGGVVPNIAKREHIKNLPVVLEAVQSVMGKKKPDIVAVTVGPGLEPALWAGIGFAKELHKKTYPKAELLGVSHMEGHLFSFLLAEKTSKSSKETPEFGGRAVSKLFPAIALVVSGGHTELLRVDSLTAWKRLGETRDDAVGEAFDKVARMLGFQYPGGPEIETHAKSGNSKAIAFPRPLMHSPDYDFSFSGLKTSVLYYLRDNMSANKDDVAASFQAAAVETLTKKTERAVTQFGARSILLSGGVAANSALRASLQQKADSMGVQFLAPSMAYNTDNAAMIGVCAYMSHLRGKRRRMTASANISL